MINQKKRICAYALIAAALTLSPLAFGQNAPATSPATDTATTSQTTSSSDDQANRHNAYHYGWIGLLGLLGLTGLMRKRDKSDRVHYAERTDDRRSTVGVRS